MPVSSTGATSITTQVSPCINVTDTMDDKDKKTKADDTTTVEEGMVMRLADKQRQWPAAITEQTKGSVTGTRTTSDRVGKIYDSNSSGELQFSWSHVQHIYSEVHIV